MSESVRSSMENTFKMNLFAALFNKEYSSVNSVHSEEWMNRMTSDTVICADGMTDILPGFAGMLIRLKQFVFEDGHVVEAHASKGENDE
ncbi:hypothetical protein ACTNBM_13060 [Lachnospiraceae bacterium HCP1S3_C3]